MSEMTWYTAVGMRDPPGEPNTSCSPPLGSSTMDGVMADNMRLPGAMAFASPCTSPNRLGLPSAVMKSSISSYNTNAAPVTLTALPKSLSSGVVQETAVPSAVTTEECVIDIPDEYAPPAAGEGVA